MIYQTMPRKTFIVCTKPEDKGFFIEGRDFDDCIKQLSKWGSEHPEKWIYYTDCGIGPANPVPVARHIIEVSFFNAEPACPVLFSRTFQEGCENRHEINEMTEEERMALRKKQMTFFGVLGSTYSV